MFFLKNLSYTIVVPSTVAIYVPWVLVPEQSASSGIWPFLATVLFFFGGTVYSWCIWDFATFGQGTPAPFDAPKYLVVRGLYQCTCNPMYASVLIVLLGWMVLFPYPPLLIYVLSVGLCMHLFVILYEELHLQKVFRHSYAEYRTQVGRWVPTLSKIKMAKTDHGRINST